VRSNLGVFGPAPTTDVRALADAEPDIHVQPRGGPRPVRPASLSRFHGRRRFPDIQGWRRRCGGRAKGEPPRRSAVSVRASCAGEAGVVSPCRAHGGRCCCWRNRRHLYGSVFLRDFGRSTAGKRNALAWADPALVLRSLVLLREVLVLATDAYVAPPRGRGVLPRLVRVFVSHDCFW